MYFGTRGNPSMTIYKKIRTLSFGVHFLQPSENVEAEYQILSKMRELNIQA
jgi:hypothetical protein